jgi:sulfide:quinone oxidoreductase
MKNITIIGAGFAGLSAVKTIRKYNKTVEITLIAPKAELVYLPSLIWVPSSRASARDILVPLDNFFQRNKVNFRPTEVTELKNAGRIVCTTIGNYTNDVLIIASGGRFIKKLKGIEHAIVPCEGLKSGELIKTKLKNLSSGDIAVGFASNPQEPSAMRGGPMFEFLFGIDTQLRQENRRDKFNLHFFTPAAKPGARLGTKAVAGLLAEMKKRDIITHLGAKITEFT